MIRTCIVFAGKVVNVVEYPELPTGTPPGLAFGHTAVPSQSGQIGWEYRDGVFTDPHPQQPAVLDTDALRAAAYRSESDPLFFQEQAGEVPPGTWAAKRAEIKERWPRTQ